MRVRVACVVEGVGEREAVPVLLRRIAAEVDPAIALDLPQPLRIPKSRLVKLGELERAVEFAARRAQRDGGMLVLLDSDDDCPKELGPALLQRARKARTDLPLAVVLAKREFEAWFLAAAASLRRLRGLSADLEPPPYPEEVRGAKEWLSARMESMPQRYSESLDQAALAAKFDLRAAQQAASFDKFYRDVTAMLTELRNRGRPGESSA